MQFHQAYIRGTRVGPVPDDQIRALAAIVVREPVEVLFTGLGAVIPAGSAGRPRQLLEDGQPAASALARRNVRSLLSRDGQLDEVAAALAVALYGRPSEAEDALEDAGLELNLRYSLFATPDAVIRLDRRTLVIANGAADAVRIERRCLRTDGRAYFGPLAMARAVMLDVDEICVTPGAVEPVYLQLEAGAVMSSDTAHRHLHKGGWRSIRKVDFIKEFCVACGRCFVHCPDNAVIHAAYDPQARETTGILGIDTDRCTACGLCAAVCPTNGDGHKAIVMIAADAESAAELHCVG